MRCVGTYLRSSPRKRGPSSWLLDSRLRGNERITNTRSYSCAGPPGGVVVASAERSAARLAHQSGGLGVPSSNLGAPTSFSHNINALFAELPTTVIAGLWLRA